MTDTTVETNIERIADWLNRVRDLAGESGCPQVVEPARQALRNRQLHHVNVVIAGAPNSGKSSVINQLLSRALLPVSVLSKPREFVITPVPPEAQERLIANGKEYPITALPDVAREAPDEVVISLSVADEWTFSHHLRLIEKPALDMTDAEIDSHAEECLRDADCVLLIADSLTPLRRTEAQFLSRCVRRGIPAIVFLAKGDRLTDQERGDVLNFVQKHVEAISGEIPVVGRAGNSTAEISTLKIELGTLIAATDVRATRNLRIAQMLLIALSELAAGAAAGLEAQHKSGAEIKRQQDRRREAIESQELLWQQIEQSMEVRRHQVTDQIREHLRTHRAGILDTLEYELDRAPDVKRWWERDLPYRLQRELRGIAGHLTGVLNRQLAVDLRWLQEELQKQFRYSLPMLTESAFSVETVSASQAEVHLTDLRRLRNVSRVGTITLVMGAGTLLATSGLAGALMAVSIGAGFLAEEAARWHSAKDRDRVRAELSQMVQTAEIEYAAAVSERLREHYQLIISELKQHQARWYQTQLQALAASVPRDAAATPDWAEISRRIHSLTAEIKALASR